MILSALFVLSITSIQIHGHWINESFVNEINSKAKHWKASLNHFDNFTEEELRNLANIRGYHSDKDYVYLTLKYNLVKNPEIPDYFDARSKWPTCYSIGTIRNQEKCGSSWAFAAVTIMSDRLCIASNSIVEVTFSPEELITCCKQCGDGCYGGYIFPPFEYWKNEGIPSGGDLYSNKGCKPYTAIGKKLPCIKKCADNYNKTWEEDARHGVTAYRVHNSEKQIQMEIMNFGPVVASMDIYKDFYVYSEGIYEHVSWDLVGRLAVKIVGWGEINDVPYWSVANSWGKEFGDQGFVKVLRGSNHCGIEHEVTAAIPNTDSE